MKFAPDHPRGRNGGPIFLGEELCPICECCSLSSVECETCGGVGFLAHDCGEDTCCCLYPIDNVPCDICQGESGFLACLGGCNFTTKQAHGPLKSFAEDA